MINLNILILFTNGLMMNKVLLVVFFAIIGNIIFAQSNVTLEAAIQSAAKNIETELPRSTIVAVLNFNSDSEQCSQHIIEQLMNNLTNGKKLVVVDRQRLETIRAEMDFQMSGEVSDDSMQSIGKKLGAQTIISGSLRDIGTSYSFTVYAINIQSGQREVSYSENLKINDPEIIFLLTGKRSTTGQAQNSTEENKSGYSSYAERDFISYITAYCQWGKNFVGGSVTTFIFDMHVTLDQFFVIGWNLRIGGIKDTKSDSTRLFISGSPQVGFVFPITKYIKIFGDGLLELGTFGGLQGIITDSITPGYEAGLAFDFGVDSSIELRYRGNWYKEGYSNAIGISFGMNY